MVKICEVVDGCEDCPKYGDDCDGDKMTEHTDLISRADAIEAVAQQWLFEASVGNPYVNDDDIGEYRKLAEELFEDVPSAEAVPWSVADKIGEDRERLEERVSELEERLEWIPCSERLPSDDDWVIVSIDYDRKAHGDNTVYWQNVTIAFYDGTWRSIESIGGESWVTAWMPLPKPYKGGAE